MTQSATRYILDTSADGVMVKVDFLNHRQDKCNHHRIEFGRRDEELTCIDCGAKVNAVTWIADHAEQLYRQSTRLAMTSTNEE